MIYKDHWLAYQCMHSHGRNAEQLLTRTRKGLAGLSWVIFLDYSSIFLFIHFFHLLLISFLLNIKKVMTMSLPWSKLYIHCLYKPTFPYLVHSLLLSKTFYISSVPFYLLLYHPLTSSLKPLTFFLLIFCQVVLVTTQPLNFLVSIHVKTFNVLYLYLLYMFFSSIHWTKLVNIFLIYLIGCYSWL